MPVSRLRLWPVKRPYRQFLGNQGKGRCCLIDRLDFTLLTRATAAATSGANRPLSAASAASSRTAVIRTLIETEPSRRASSEARQAETAAFVKPPSGSVPNQSKNSWSACASAVQALPTPSIASQFLPTILPAERWIWKASVTCGATWRRASGTSGILRALCRV